MFRSASLLLSVLLSLFLLPGSAQKTAVRLSAPTFYIAASTEFDGSNWLYLKGASNLPSGAHLVINVYDFVGQGSSVLNVETDITVDKNGFFGAKVGPKPRVEFRHNLVCDIIFMPTFPKQEPGVLRFVGKEGEQLGFSSGNPQAKVSSGGYYLSELIHVP